eukprot:11173298-Lingulodinium_polyedra.AAC.1
MQYEPIGFSKLQVAQFDSTCLKLLQLGSTRFNLIQVASTGLNFLHVPSTCSTCPTFLQNASTGYH